MDVGVRVLVRVCDLVAAMASPARVIAKIAARARAMIRFVFIVMFSLKKWVNFLFVRDSLSLTFISHGFHNSCQ